jgi:hypothetical protein
VSYAFDFPASRRILGTAAALFLWGIHPAPCADAEVAPVYRGPPAPYQSPTAAAQDPAALRTLRVEERVGVVRRGELVRAPLFFAAGECPSPDSVEIVPEGGGDPLPSQADDVRLGPDGGVSRMHLWFEADLEPWQRKKFLLVRRSGAARGGAGAPAQVQGDALMIPASGGEFLIGISGGRAGLLLGARFADGASMASGEGLAPVAKFTYSAASGLAPVVLPAPGTAPSLEWSSGPLFTKVRARWASGDAQLEQVFRVGRSGREIEISQTASPGVRTGSVLAARDLLSGAIDDAGARVVKVPAGLRSELRAVYGYTVSAVVPEHGGPSILAVPVVIGGSAGKILLEDGRLRVASPWNLVQTGDALEGTLRAFWTEERLVACDSAEPAALWTQYHASVQPLVAIVDEPGLSEDELEAAIRSVVADMQPIGWRQQAGRLSVVGKAAECNHLLTTVPKPAESDPEYLKRGAESAWAKLSQNGLHRLREDEKSRASGPIDPYNITYSESAAAPLDVLEGAPPLVHRIGAANAVAAREFLGRTDEHGFPYIDCFSRALNMQMGSVLFGLVAGKDDPGTGAFYRDLIGSPAVRGVYARAQRPYTEKIGPGADYSDFLYQAICDFWIRAGELLADEDLELHPLAYGRYTDCIDVLSDQYHAFDIKDADGSAGLSRANFWRAQPHTHRWLGWSCSPFIRILERPGDPTGATEMVQFCRMLHGRWKNWPDLTLYIMAATLRKDGLGRYHRPVLLPRPGAVKSRHTDAGNALDWPEVSGATGYRIYRASVGGGPLTWINSPYEKAAAVTAAPFIDPAGKAGDSYVVTAVDASGREGRWFSEGP